MKKLLPILTEDENVHPKNPVLLQINLETFPNWKCKLLKSHEQSLRTDLWNIAFMEYSQLYQWSLIFFAQKSQQTTSAGFQSEKLPTTVISNRNINNTRTTESIPSTEVTEISLHNSSTLKPGIIMSLQLPKEQIEAVLIVIIIPKHLKGLHLKIIPYLQLLINLNSKTLQHCHFRNSKKLNSKYFFMINLLNRLTKFRAIQRFYSNQITMHSWWIQNLQLFMLCEHLLWLCWFLLLLTLWVVPTLYRFQQILI